MEDGRKKPVSQNMKKLWHSRPRLCPGSKLEFIVLDDERLEVIPMAETLVSLKGMVPRPKKTLSLEDMEEAVARGVKR